MVSQLFIRFLGSGCLLAWILVHASLLNGQSTGEADPATWWNDLKTREGLSDQARLVAQTEMLEEVGPRVGWRDAGVWEWTREVLQGWEASPAIDEAYTAYLSLLELIGREAAPSMEPLPAERVLRDYYQRALSIARTERDGGRLFLRLAESLMRSEGDSEETRRRIESFLQQAALTLPEEPPLDGVHLHLARLYREWGQAEQAGEGEDSYLSKAVFHYRQVLDMESSREPLREQARLSLDALLQPGLELLLQNRFLPENDLRVAIRTRNLNEVRILVYALPWMGKETPLSLEAMRRQWLTGEPPPEDIRSDEVHTLSPRHRFDWERTEFSMGENYPGGWYGVRVEGGSLRAEELLLVSSLEVVAVPRRNGTMTVWVADSETGQPVPEAPFVVLDREGAVLKRILSGAQGMARLETEALEDWQEIHVSDGLNPGVVRRQDLPSNPDAPPWLVSGMPVVRPGERVDWVLFGIEAGQDADAGENLPVELPDGSTLLAEGTRTGEAVLQGSVFLPRNPNRSGPVYLRLPGGERLLLTHLAVDRAYPLEVAVSGEPFGSMENLFLDTAPLGIRILGTPAGLADPPEYIRVTLHPLARAVIPPPESSPAERGKPVFERILSFNESAPGGTYFELPPLGTFSEIGVFEVVVRPLGEEEILGQGHLAIVPFRSLVNLQMDQHIIRTGEAVEVKLSLPDGETLSARSLEGQLLVFRETWESRYIHRKRGTPLSEEEYLALPDRSLLGSAKTDYRLAEQGFVREEISRLPVPAGPDVTVPIQLERSGYYRIEYSGRDLDTRAHYPDGPLEVWVIPADGDLRAFRSDKPRLIHERLGPSTDEILLLLDRPGVSVLLDLEYEEGGGTTEWFAPEETALFLERPRPGDSALARCRAAVVGERQTNLLAEEVTREEPVEFSIGTDKLDNLNPGISFAWPLTVVQGRLRGPLYWGIFSQDGGSILKEWLRQQRHNRSAILHNRTADISSLGRWLPVFHPLETTRPDGSRPPPARHIDLLEPVSLKALYPELWNPQHRSGEDAILNRLDASLQAGDSRVLEGRLPAGAGLWDLATFSLTSHEVLHWEDWLLSTELPIRASMLAPGLLRLQDEVRVSLELENATRVQETLEIFLESDGSIELEGRARDAGVLAAGQEAEVPITVRASQPGAGSLRARVSSDNSSSDAALDFRVQQAPRDPALLVRVVPPGQKNYPLQLPAPEMKESALMVSATLGAALPELWTALRKKEFPSEPLLSALGDWAVQQAQLRHGMRDRPDPLAASVLGRQLTLRLAPRGGLSWIEGHDPDPWLSALVYWAVEMFAQSREEVFADFLEQTHAYLESILVDESIPEGSRLLALRALSAPAVYGGQRSLSRIQAKTFLEFLHRRGSLDTAEIAILLQIARSYQFMEEVGLLEEALQGRLSARNAPVADTFWRSSLIYLALDSSTSSRQARQRMLAEAFAHLSESGLRRSWQQVGGFLNLLAVFNLEGDLMVDGTAMLKINGSEPVSLFLNPDHPEHGFFRQPLPDAGPDGEAPQLILDTTGTENAVLVLVLGEQSQPDSHPSYPEHTVAYFREYLESTLLSGVRQQVVALDDSLRVQTGDILQVRIAFYVEESEDFAELQFTIPAGASLPDDAVQYEFEPVSSEALFEPPVISAHEQSDPLQQVIRLEPLATGRHEFILSYRAEWEGRFVFPPSTLVIPRTGDAYQLGEARRLEVVP